MYHAANAGPNASQGKTGSIVLGLTPLCIGLREFLTIMTQSHLGWGDGGLIAALKGAPELDANQISLI